MSKDPENFQKEVGEIKKLVKTLDIRTRSLEDKVDQILALMNTITVLISESESEIDFDDDEDEEWNPYKVENEFDEDADSDDSSDY